MKITSAAVQKALLLMIVICVLITAAGSILFAVFADFLAQFPANGF